MHIYRHPSRELLCSLPKLPYFYIIQHKETEMYYAGCKTAKPDPASFMCEYGYCTSSKIIHAMIQNDSCESFRIVELRFFVSEDDAHSYEQRFLSKVDARNNDRFYNLTNGYGGHVMMGNKPKSSEHKTNISLALRGKKKSQEHIDNMNRNPEKIRKTAEKHRGMKRTLESRERMSAAKQNYVARNKGKRYFRSPDNETGDYFTPGRQPELWIQGTGKRK